MRRKLAMMLAITMLSAAAAVTGCAETPEDDLVAQKNNDRLIENAQKDPDGNSLEDTADQAPPDYTWSYANEEETVAVDVEAQVKLPEGDSIPMYRISSGEIPQSLVTAIYDYFYPEGNTWTMEGNDLTKARCEEFILDCRKRIADAEAGIDMEGRPQEEIDQVLEHLRSELEYWEETYETAPEESTLHKIPADGTLTDNQQDGVHYQSVYCQDDSSSLSVLSAPSDSSWGSSIQYSRTLVLNRGDPDKHLDETTMTYSGATGIPFRELSQEMVDSCPVTRSDAQEIADGFFAAIGVDAGMQEVFGVQALTYADSGDDPDGYGESDTLTGWRFCYARQVDGIDLAVTSSQYVDGDDTSLTWLYEQIYVIVGENGIEYLDWQYPLTLGETVSENVGLLSFDEAKEVFERMAPLVYEGYVEEEMELMRDVEADGYQVSYKTHVDRVQMTLMRVKDSGADRTGLLTPVWVFYGSETKCVHRLNEISNEWEDIEWTEDAPWIVLAVNAVDGSVIDILHGY